MTDHPVVIRLAEEIEQARVDGKVAADVNAMNSAVFFLLGLYALLITTNDWPTRNELLDDYVTRTVRSIESVRP